MTRPTMASSIWKMCFAVDEESEVLRHHICSSLAGEIAAASASPWPELASPARRLAASAPPRPEPGSQRHFPPLASRRIRTVNTEPPTRASPSRSETEAEMLWPSSHTHRGLQTPAAARRIQATSRPLGGRDNCIEVGNVWWAPGGGRWCVRCT